MTRIIQDLVLGELQQITSIPQGSKTDDRFNTYLSKTYNKTASLMANSCQAVAQMAAATTVGRGGHRFTKTEHHRQAIDSAFSYGKNLGIAFQLMDDYLDFTTTSEQIGKPTAVDLKWVNGNIPTWLHWAEFYVFFSGWVWPPHPFFLPLMSTKN